MKYEYKSFIGFMVGSIIGLILVMIFDRYYYDLESWRIASIMWETFWSWSVPLSVMGSLYCNIKRALRNKGTTVCLKVSPQERNTEKSLQDLQW
jgi:hypothetical protein